VLKGGVAVVVFKKAVEALPNAGAAARLQFLDALSDLKGFEMVEHAILSSVEADFASDADAWHQRAQWPMRQAECGRMDPKEAEARSMEVYQSALSELKVPEIFERFVDFLRSRCAVAAEADADVCGDREGTLGREALMTKLEDAYMMAERVGAHSPHLAVGRAALLVELGKSDHAAEVLAAACQEEACRGSARVWSAALQLAAQRKSDNVDLLADMSVQALHAVPDSEALDLWAQIFEMHALLDMQAKPLLNLLEQRLSVTCLHLGDVAAMAVEWLVATEGLNEGREFYKRLLVLPGPSLTLFNSCIRLEDAAAQAKAFGDGITPELKRVRLLLEAAIALYGSQDAALWLQLAQCERRAFGKEGKVYWRAIKQLIDPAEFIGAYKSMA